MKKMLFLFATLTTFSLLAFGFVNWGDNDKPTEEKPSSAPELFDNYLNQILSPQTPEDFVYNIGSRFNNTLTKEIMDNARTVVDLVPEKSVKGIKSFRDVNITILPRDKGIIEEGGGNL